MKRLDWTRIGLAIAAPVVAMVSALAITTLILLAVGDPIAEV